MTSTPNNQRMAEHVPAPRLKVLVVAADDSLGGAARAITRVFQSLRTFASQECDVRLRVIHKRGGHSAAIGGKPIRSKQDFTKYFIRTRFRKLFPRPDFISENSLLRSQALYPSGLADEINAMGPDLVLFGWLGNGTLSIEEIGSVKAPKIFRLSDMWVFSGSEHYDEHRRFRDEYSKQSRPVTESGPDIDFETFRRKQRSWKSGFNLVAISSWLEREAGLSSLTREWPKEIIPVPLDTEKWRPENRTFAREAFGLSKSSKVILFGAGAGTSQPHKGFDLLAQALPFLAEKWNENQSSGALILVIFGQQSGPKRIGGIPVLYVGRLDDTGLRNAYSAADVMVVPSRLEAFGQVAAEAQSCGTPVVVFDNSGLTDVVADRVTGRVVPAFDTNELAEAIAWVVGDEDRQKRLGAAARARALELWHPKVVAAQYLKVFRSVLENSSAKIEP